jgi:hypothetical protein
MILPMTKPLKDEISIARVIAFFFLIMLVSLVKSGPKRVRMDPEGIQKEVAAGIWRCLFILMLRE